MEFKEFDVRCPTPRRCRTSEEGKFKQSGARCGTLVKCAASKFDIIGISVCKFVTAVEKIHEFSLQIADIWARCPPSGRWATSEEGKFKLLDATFRRHLRPSEGSGNQFQQTLGRIKKPAEGGRVFGPDVLHLADVPHLQR